MVRFCWPWPIFQDYCWNKTHLQDCQDISQIFHKNICYGYLLEIPGQGTSNEYPQRMFLWRNKTNYHIIITQCSFLTSPLFRLQKKKKIPIRKCIYIYIYIWHVAGVGSSLTQSSGISYFSLYTFFWSTCISIDPGPEFFVEVCLNYNNIFKLQYPMDPESSLYIMSALAHQKYTLSDGSFRAIKHNTVPWNLFLTSVVVQWLCLLTLKGKALPS